MAKKAAKRSAKKGSKTAKKGATRAKKRSATAKSASTGPRKTSKTARKGSSTAKTARKGAKKTARKAARRELIDTGSDARYVRRDQRGQFDESDKMSRALPADRRTKARKRTRPGQGDKGDR
jgi:hypothetical protein